MILARKCVIKIWEIKIINTFLDKNMSLLKTFSHEMFLLLKILIASTINL